MLEPTREQITGEFVDLSFRVPADKAEMVKRVMRALVEPEDAGSAGEKEYYTPEEVFGPSSPARALRGYRYREGLTQAALADLAGVSKQNISDMENGRRVIGKEVAQRLGKALGAPWKRFL